MLIWDFWTNDSVMIFRNYDLPHASASSVITSYHVAGSYFMGTKNSFCL